MATAATATAQPPTHGRGTAAEQGAKIRAEMQERQKANSSLRGSKKSSKKQTRPREDRKAAQVVSEKPATKRDVEAEKTSSEPAKTKEASTLQDEKANSEAEKPKETLAQPEEKKAATAAPAAAAVGTAAAAGGAAATKGKKEPSLEPKGRCYPVTGIDNLALLMEGDAYSTTCFSTYLFKTELDSRTLETFFRKLVDWYPKYHYVVELSPQEAAKKEKARKQALKKGEEGPTPQRVTAQDKAGRRTRWSKTLKAGGFFRPARWRYSDEFDVMDNVEERTLAPGDANDDQALFRIAGEFLSEHFDFTKPLWKALCIRGLNTSKGAKSALMIKVHHALSDGQGMIMSYHTALAALEHDAPIKEVQKQVDHKSSKGEQKKPGQRNIQPTVWGTTKHGWHTVRGLYFRSRKAFDYRDEKRTNKRTYCHSDGIPMSDIKFVRDAFSDAGLQLTLNDVACAVLSRALRMAAERTEKPGTVKDKRVALFVPISKRPPGNWELTNFTTGAIAWFAFNDPKKVPYKDQLAQVHREMGRIKRSHWPTIWYKLFGEVSKRRAFFLPNYAGWRAFFERTYREYHVATNLPGPSTPVKFGAEHEAFAYHVLPPSSPGKSSLAIGMISYAGDFSLAVSCDAAAALEKRKLAQEICNAFQDAAKELLEAAKQEREKTQSSKAQ